MGRGESQQLGQAATRGGAAPGEPIKLVNQGYQPSASFDQWAERRWNELGQRRKRIGWAYAGVGVGALALGVTPLGAIALLGLGTAAAVGASYGRDRVAEEAAGRQWAEQRWARAESYAIELERQQIGLPRPKRSRRHSAPPPDQTAVLPRVEAAEQPTRVMPIVSEQLEDDPAETMIMPVVEATRAK
jgi:hypothetical protein